MFKKEFVIENLEQLKDFANKISKCLQGNEIILLKGDLGSGKTTFTRFLVENIDKEAAEYVNSPTFNILNEYDTERFKIYHLDLYRVKNFDISDIAGMGLVVVEWPDTTYYELDEPIIDISFEIFEGEKRKISLYVKNGESVEECLKQGL
ncbi:tRNA (adenosine(37)-N6)-threonylcarbamoyltransferase complex ATPase subunit type 1 TsaE [Persephonella sp.]